MRSRFLLAVLAVPPGYAADPGADVQRLIRDREQQHIELRLRMQQQQNRALNPPASHAADFQLRQVEKDQQQRLREQLELEAREREAREAGPTEATRALRPVEDAPR